LKEFRGCDGGKEHKILDYEISLCPLKFLTWQVSSLLQAYDLYEGGLLPNSGGWLDQPAKYIEAMVLIKKILCQFRKEEQGA